MAGASLLEIIQDQELHCFFTCKGRRGPGVTTAQARWAPGPARCSPAARAARSSRLLPPRRLPHRAAEALGQQKQEGGSVGVSPSPRGLGCGLEEEGTAPCGVQGVHEPRVPSAAPESGYPATARSAPRSSSCAAAGARCAVAAAAPESAKEGAMRGEAAGLLCLPGQRCGIAGLGRGVRCGEAYLSGGADSSCAPSLGVWDRKIKARGGPGQGCGWLRDKVGGSISTAKKTLPSRPGLFGKLQERTWGRPGPPRPRSAGGGEGQTGGRGDCWRLGARLEVWSGAEGGVCSESSQFAG